MLTNLFLSCNLSWVFVYTLLYIFTSFWHGDEHRDHAQLQCTLLTLFLSCLSFFRGQCSLRSGLRAVVAAGEGSKEGCFIILSFHLPFPMCWGLLTRPSNVTKASGSSQTIGGHSSKPLTPFPALYLWNWLYYSLLSLFSLFPLLSLRLLFLYYLSSLYSLYSLLLSPFLHQTLVILSISFIFLPLNTFLLCSSLYLNFRPRSFLILLSVSFLPILTPI